jgi:hypothetical protein
MPAWLIALGALILDVIKDGLEDYAKRKKEEAQIRADLATAMRASADALEGNTSKHAVRTAATQAKLDELRALASPPKEPTALLERAVPPLPEE